MEEPIISIICNTYNHEDYIADALESFLMQKVSVPFEILVNDDASTDHTAEIVRSYEKSYPKIIKPLYQDSNQYSKDIVITYEIQMPRAKGKYIAFCEGDDYWTDEFKLQKQYDFLENHSDYSGCCHAYSRVTKNKELICERFDFDKDCDVPLAKLIGDQLAIPQFATWFVRKNCFYDFDGHFLGQKCNDMVMRIFCYTQGKLRYLNENMSCYRRFAENSWTLRVGMNKGKMAVQVRSYIPFLEKLDEYLNYSYHHEILQEIDNRMFQSCVLEDKYKDALHFKAFKKQSIMKRIYIRIGSFFPKLIIAIKEIKNGHGD